VTERTAASLQAVYGNDDALLAAQRQRYAKAVRRFVEHFGPGETRVLRTPGRINLIGEHTDYNGGFVLPVALDKDILLVARPRSDRVVRSINVEDIFPPFSFELSQEIPPAPRGGWSNYFRGAAQEIDRKFGRRFDVRGMDVCVSGAPPHGVPRGSGLSSSTAVTVTVALALVTLNRIEVERADLAHLCSKAEWYVGTRGGMMDQFAALLSRRDHALFLDCRPSPEDRYHFDHVPVPGDVQVVLLNSGVHHENVRSQFNQRVAECRIGVELLRREYPAIARLRDVTPEALGLSEPEFWAALESVLPAHVTAAGLVERGLDREWLAALIADHHLDPGARFTVLPRCRHVITENRRVLAGIAALRSGDVGGFGRLMDAAHASMRDEYEASCPEVDALVEIARRQPGVLGARITGAGWGGGVVALVGRDAGSGWPEAIRAAYKAEVGLDADVFICRPGGAAGEVVDWA
jgi:galactokinase